MNGVEHGISPAILCELARDGVQYAVQQLRGHIRVEIELQRGAARRFLTALDVHWITLPTRHIRCL